MALELVPLHTRRRLKIWLYNLRTRDSNKRIHVRRNGAVIELSIGDERIALASIGRWSKYRQGVRAQLHRLAGRYGLLGLEKAIAGGTVIDIGANIGELGLFCNALGCRVLAIEPDPINFDALTANARGTSIEPANLALWDTETELTFYSAVARADSSLIKPADFERSFAVRTKTLDGFASESGVDRAVLLKMDAEGAEPEVLRGGRETLLRTRFVTIDCGPERMGERTFDACRDILQGLGFETRAVDAAGNVLFAENPAYLPA
jgi:FkbM family methyltransferase